MNSDQTGLPSGISRRRFIAGTAATTGLFFTPAILRAAPITVFKPDLLVRPSLTDPQIRTFDFTHGVYFPAPNTPRRGLFVFFPGTETDPNAIQRPGVPWLCRWAALLGYHAVFLMYPNTIAAAETCRDSPDLDAFSIFRWAIIEGGDTPYIKIPRVESIENRLIKLLVYLRSRFPHGGWGEFLVGGRIDWARVVVSGGSQGGGHAAIIATKQLVGRVLCFGAPKDYSRHAREPAKWYDNSVTPAGRYFAFNHRQDDFGCTPDQQIENLKRLGVFQLGSADVDQEARPFHGAHALFTNYPGTKIDHLEAHVSVSVGDIQAPAPTGRPHFAPVWGYMLTAPVE